MNGTSGTSLNPIRITVALPFYNGWKVFINDEPASIRRMNWAFSGVQAGPKSQRIFLLYSPGSVKLGALISVISIIVLLIITVRINHAARKT